MQKFTSGQYQVVGLSVSRLTCKNIESLYADQKKLVLKRCGLMRMVLYQFFFFFFSSVVPQTEMLDSLANATVL